MIGSREVVAVPWRLRIIISLLVAITTASCGSDAAGSEVDPAALQPGNYPTTPRSSEQLRTPDNVDRLEALRLAEHIPLLSDIHPRMVHRNPAHNGRMYTPAHPPTEHDSGVYIADFPTAAPGLVAGWGSHAARREPHMLGRDMYLDVLAFEEPAQAVHAAHAKWAALEAESPVQKIAMPGYADALSYEVTQEGRVIGLTTLIAHERFFVRLYISAGLDINPSAAPLMDMTTRTFDALFGGLRGYRPKPPAERSSLPVDIDGLLAHTLPPAEGGVEAVFVPSVALQALTRPDSTARAFEDAGVDLVSLGGATVYRTQDSTAAVRLHSALVDQLDPRYEPADAPPALPEATCVRKSDRKSYRLTSLSTFECVFTRDRYTVTVKAEQIQDLYQKAAAQYLLLDEMI